MDCRAKFVNAHSFSEDLEVFRRLDRRDSLIKDIRLQPIVDREEQVVGFEVLARLNGDGFSDSLGDKIGKLSKDELGRLISELLLGLRLRCLLGGNYASRIDFQKVSRAPIRYFVNVEKISLTDPAVVDELIESSVDLQSAGNRLVVEVTERPLVVPSQFRSYIGALKRLKREGVLIALDDYDIDSSTHWELDLGLCDVVKLDLLGLGVFECFDEGLNERRYRHVVEKLFELSHRYHVDVLAEKVENDRQYGLVKSLPFDLFQGCRFGRSVQF